MRGREKRSYNELFIKGFPEYNGLSRSHVEIKAKPGDSENEVDGFKET